MTIYVTGDLHGGHDGAKLFHPALDNCTKDDYLIVCGDFGIPWSDHSEYEAELLRRVSARPYTTLFVDGNHENHNILSYYPVEEWHGGKVHKLTNSVIHLMRGQVYELEDNTIFVMGGARSVDKHWRTPGKSWWPEEIPSGAERAEALANLEAHGNKVDYIISHCAPASIFEAMCDSGCLHAISKEYDEYTDWLEANIKAKAEYKRWYFGHYHETHEVDERHCCLMNRIMQLPETPDGEPTLLPHLLDAEPMRFVRHLQMIEPVDEADREHLERWYWYREPEVFWHQQLGEDGENIEADRDHGIAFLTHKGPVNIKRVVE